MTRFFYRSMGLVETAVKNVWKIYATSSSNPSTTRRINNETVAWFWLLWYFFVCNFVWCLAFVISVVYTASYFPLVYSRFVQFNCFCHTLESSLFFSVIFSTNIYITKLSSHHHECHPCTTSSCVLFHFVIFFLVD